MRIVVGLDDSAHSRATMEFLRALPWARRERWEIVSALHSPIAAYAPADPDHLGRAIEAADAEARRQEAWLADTERELHAAGVASHATLAEADARTALVQAARDLEADVVVVGFRGRSGIDRLVLGSVASHVAVHAPCSVLVVKPPAHRLDFERRPMSLVLGVDESPCSQAAVDLVLRLTWPERVSMEVVTTLRPEVQSVDVTDGLHVGFASSLVEESRVRREVAIRYERRLRDAGYRASMSATHGDPRERLVDAAADSGADLLVVGSHGRTGLSKLLLGSVSSYALSHAPCSVLVVKPPRRT